MLGPREVRGSGRPHPSSPLGGRGVLLGACALACVAVLTSCGNDSERTTSTGSDPVTAGGKDAATDAGERDGAGASPERDASFGFPSLGLDAGPLDGSVRLPPTSVPEGWACRQDFALDLFCDCGCGNFDDACEPTGCADARCTVNACEACFDESGLQTPCGAPGAWLCALSRKNDGVCDCGCGDFDPDCGGAGCYPWGCNVTGCERCLLPSGVFGDCPEPAAWTCAESARSDGKCDCGCGNVDPDCLTRACSERGCRAEGCQVCRDAQGKVTSCAPPAKWRCAQSARADGHCDCGCGDVDPDCNGKGCSEGRCDESACERCHDELGRALPCPARYSCDLQTYADGTLCDCGCGAEDPDCDGKGCSASECKADACDVRHGDGGKLLVPSAWSCAPTSYGASDGCDCGCGALDPDCRKRGGGCSQADCKDAQCDRCHAASGALTTCRFSCDVAHFASGDGCDCGCAEADPDCGGLGCEEAQCFAAACTRCWNDDASASSCERSACPAAAFGDGTCDCGCREADPDCAGRVSCVSPDCSEPSCGRCHTDDGSVTTCGDWYCTLEKQGGGDGCNCGCGAIDADCGGAGCSEPGCAEAVCITCRSLDAAPMSCAP